MATYYPAANADDGNWYTITGDHYFSNNSDTTSFSSIGGVFCRFASVAVPIGATITSAVLKVYCAQNGTSWLYNNITFENADDPTAPTTWDDADGRTRTAAVQWEITTDWTENTQYSSPELSTILQTVIDRVGWVSGNHVNIFISYNTFGTASRWVDTIETDSGATKMELVVTYTGGTSAFDETTSESFSVADEYVDIFGSFDGVQADSFSVDDITLGTYSESNNDISESFSVDDYVDDATFHDENIESFSVDDTNAYVLPIEDTPADSFSVDDAAEGEVVLSAQLDVELDSPFFTIEAYTGGALGWFLPTITISGTATTGVVATGESDLALAAITSSGNTGAVLNTDLWTPYDIALSAGATTNTSSNLDGSIPTLTVAGHAYVELLGTLAKDLPRLRSTAVALLDVNATSDAQIPRYTLSSYSYSGYIADLTENLPGFNIEATGYESGGAVTLDKSLPALWLVSVAHGGQTGYYSVPVMNVRKGAVSEWNLGFNSIAYFNGKTLATDGTKIYEIGGTTDDVASTDADITSNIKTGNLDLANSGQVRFTDAYANIKSDGNVKFQFELDESTTYDFTMTMHDLDDTHEEKVNLGRGMKARVYAVSLYNVDGSQYRLNRLQFIGDKLD